MWFARLMVFLVSLFVFAFELHTADWSISENQYLFMAHTRPKAHTMLGTEKLVNSVCYITLGFIGVLLLNSAKFSLLNSSIFQSLKLEVTNCNDS